LTLTTKIGNFWLAALLGGIAIALLGLVLERVFLSRLYRQYNEQVLLTLGFVFILGNVVLWVWGPWVKTGTPPPDLAGSIAIGSLFFPFYRVVLMLIGLLAFAALWWLQDKTRVGAIIRAGMDDKEMTMALGINYGLVCSATFCLGTFMGAVVGFIATPVLTANPEMGFPFFLLAMIVVTVGGMGRVQGTLLGSITIGIIDSLGKAFFPELAMFTIYAVFIIILLVKPAGLLGRKW
jgi:branched-chain amino acid transport system permease protein